jgi:SAM-dependent methyltransferase
MVFAVPMPDEDAWADYNSRYFDNAHGGVSRDSVTAAFHSAMGGLRVAHVLEYIRERHLNVSSVLEVGPGRADFARHWLARQGTVAYHAIESDASLHSGLAAQGISLVDGPGDFPTGTSVDLLVLSHVLEHVTDPMDFLGAMTMRLRSGGGIFIEVPCRDWEHKALDEPHLLFFDKLPMRRLLERCGFEHVRLSYHGQAITRLRRQRTANKAWHALRIRLLSWGLVAPFDSAEPLLDCLELQLERAAVRPFEAHRESKYPSWWLRAVAVKQ